MKGTSPTPNHALPYTYGAPHEADDGRMTAPAALRNAPHILAELKRIAPPKGRLLELASGTGEHAIRFAPALPGLTWQPTDVDPARLASITAWSAAYPTANLSAPVLLDAAQPGWAEAQEPADCVLLVNLLHLITEAAAEAVLQGMARVLAPCGRAAIYGPFLVGGQTTSAGDAAFHARIQAETPGAGYKDVEWVIEVMQKHGACHLETVDMPANNRFMVFSTAP